MHVSADTRAQRLLSGARPRAAGVLWGHGSQLGKDKGGLSDGEPRCQGKKRGASGESARTGVVCRPGWSAGGRTGGGGDGTAEWEPAASDCWLSRVKLS